MKKIIIYFMLLLALPTCLLAQVTATVGGTVGANYQTLQSAFNAINDGSIDAGGGAIILQIVASTSETGGTAILYPSGYSGFTTYSSILIYPTGSGYTISGNLNTPLIEIIGASNVTLDGRVGASGSVKNLVITNINTGASAATIKLSESATVNIIKYCIIKGAETGTTSGVVFFSTALSGSGNNGNTLDQNDITSDAAGRPVNAVFSSGSATKENSGNTISNNNIYNFLNSGITSNGIFLSSNTTSFTISGNSFFETSSFVPSANVTYTTIKIDNTSGTGFVINGNYIGGQSASCGGSAWDKTIAFNNIFYAVYLNVGTGTTSNIQNNTIKNFNYSNSSSAAWTGIHIEAGDVNIGTSSGNIIGATTGTGSVTVTGAATNTIVYGINIASGGTVDCQNNIIGSITAANSNSNYATNLYGINKTATSGSTTIKNNSIGSTSTINSLNAICVSTSNAQSVYGISNAGTGNISIQGNTIANLSNGTTNSTVGTLGLINGIKSTNGNNSISGNIIHDLTIANANNTASNTASVCAIALTGSTLKAVSGNTIYNLKNTFSSFTGSIIGLYFTGSTGANTVSENLINGLSVTGASSTSASIYGIQIAAGAATYSNNIVSLGGNSQTTLYGIYETGLAGNNNSLYYNTVYINGIPTAGSANSYSLFSAVNTNTRNFRNNIFSNARSNSGATGKHYAVYITSAGGTITTDYNDYYTSGTGGMLGYLAGDISNLSAWKTATGQDVNSLSTNPSFTNAGGSLSDDYLPTISLGAITGTGILTDYNGAARSLSTPTMGALEAGSCTNPSSGGTIASTQNGCSPFDPAPFTSTLPASGYTGASLEYKWQQSITSSSAGFSDIAASNSLTYNPGPLTQTTWYKRLARVTCTTWAGAAESNVLAMTVNALPVANAIIGGNTVCPGGTLLLTSNATGAPALSYTWASSNNGIATVNNSGLVTATSAGSASITYTVTDGNVCMATSPTYPVTVNSLPAIGLAVGGAGITCSGSSTNISVGSSESGMNYQLRNDNANELVGSPTVGNGGTINLPTGSIAFNTTYNVLATNIITSCYAQLTQKVTVTIDPPSAGGSISGTSPITYGSSTGTMTLTGYTGVIQRWEKRLNSGSWTTISNTSSTYSETPASAGTWGYRAVVKSGTCPEANSAEFSITVNKAPLTVTADNKSKAYDGLVFSPFTVTYSGFVNSETSAVLGGSLTFSGTAATATNAGTYVITPAGLASDNYIFNYVNGQLTINKVPLTVTAADKSKSYDGSVFSPFTITYSGFVNSETSAVLGGSLTFSGTATTATNAGTYVITPAGLTSGNYTISFADGQLTINKALLTVTAADKSKSYDGLVFSAFTVTYSGFVNSETSAVLGGSLTFSGTAATATNAGTYVITPGGLTSGNYTISYADGHLTIDKVLLTVTAVNKSKSYDGFVFSPFTVTYSGFVNSETSAVLGGSLSFSGTAATAINAGTYVITPGGLTSVNYTFNYVSGQLIIIKVPLTVTAADKSKPYDGLVFSPFTATYSGFVNSETSAVLLGSLTFSGTAATATNAGTYAITPAGLTSPNYTIAFVNGQLIINKINLTFTSDNKTKIFQQANPTLTYVISGFVNGENLTVLEVLPSIQTTATQNSPVGTYPITISGGNDNCYNYIYVPGTLTITRYLQTITFTDIPKKLLQGDTYTLVASSTSGLAVLFESMDTQIATVTGNQLTGVSKGNARIRAFNTGDANYQPGEVIGTVEIYTTHKDIMHLFTPNGDGINDYWELPQLAEWGKCEVRVFNRWGKQVFADDNYNNLWDGTSNGSPLPEGPYYFIIKTENSGSVKGTVNIVR